MLQPKISQGPLVVKMKNAIRSYSYSTSASLPSFSLSSCKVDGSDYSCRQGPPVMCCDMPWFPSLVLFSHVIPVHPKWLIHLDRPGQSQRSLLHNSSTEMCLCGPVICTEYYLFLCHVKRVLKEPDKWQVIELCNVFWNEIAMKWSLVFWSWYHWILLYQGHWLCLLYRNTVIAFLTLR